MKPRFAKNGVSGWKLSRGLVKNDARPPARPQSVRRGLNCPNEHGFTLLEILVAVVILGLSYVALLQNFAQSTRTIFRLEQKREEIGTTSHRLEEYIRGSTEDGGVEVDSSYREGLQYRVILVADESGTFMTLKLTRR